MSRARTHVESEDAAADSLTAGWAEGSRCQLLVRAPPAELAADQHEPHAELGRRHADGDEQGGRQHAAATEGEGVAEHAHTQNAVHQGEARLQLAAPCRCYCVWGLKVGNEEHALVRVRKKGRVTLEAVRSVVE